MPSVSTDRFPEPTLAIEFLGKKVNQETVRWDDLKWGEHAHAFTVAHSNEAAVLDTIHGLLNDAIKEGKPFNDFRNGMLDMMKAKGWYGGDGHTADEKQYINWRIKTIYETNMRTAYAQAQYRKQLQGAELRPVWVYRHSSAVRNARPDHLALDGKAFRYDDPFWDKYYPPNGWGCQCYVTTKSEAGADRDKIKVGDSTKETLPDIDETWSYNPGREALAPNFNRYTNLPKETLKQIYANYRKSMDNTRTTQGEFKTILKRTNEADYKPMGQMYQIGNLDDVSADLNAALTGVGDSKIMATDHDLWHGTGHKHKRIADAQAAGKPQKEIDKLKEQLIDAKDFGAVYETMQSPERIYRDTQTNVKDDVVVLHFVKTMQGGKLLRIVIRAKYDAEKGIYTSPELITMEMVNENDYRNKRYETVKK
jgi:SPP1 gp7 family putative phage head morphogenesis protein